MERLAELRKKLLHKKLDALLVTKPVNRNYLSGFTGSTAFLVVTLRSALFVTDSRYTEQAKKEINGEFKLVEIKSTKEYLSLIHISEPTRLGMISYAVFCLKKKTSQGDFRLMSFTAGRCSTPLIPQRPVT